MIIFESHSTSVDNENGIASGWLDPPLSKKGIEQARELGQRYASKHFSTIYVSDLLRSYMTAKIAFSERNILIIQDVRLREWNYGDYNGHKTSKLEILKPNYIDIPFQNGESLHEVIHRFTDFKKNLIQTSPLPILIIGHRAIHYALEYFFTNTPLLEIVTKPWKWQPGWSYFEDLTF